MIENMTPFRVQSGLGSPQVQRLSFDSGFEFDQFVRTLTED